MTARVAAVLAVRSGAAQCSRCHSMVAVAAGRWHAAEADRHEHPVCDPCSARDDLQGHRVVLAWRRAAAGPATGRRTA